MRAMKKLLKANSEEWQKPICVCEEIIPARQTKTFRFQNTLQILE